MIDKCPVTGLPTQSLFTNEEVADFAALDDKVRTWFAHSERVDRPLVRKAICHFYDGRYDEAVATLREEFKLIDSCMSAEDMAIMVKWYDCLRVGLSA